jgi:hypothetical protein
VRELLSDFGRLLSETLVAVSKQPEVTKDSPLKTGSLFTLPGDVIHAGPSTTGVRAILFLVASSNNTRKYNPDVQYNRTNMWVTIAEYVWVPMMDDQHSTGVGRRYLLEKIKECAALDRSSSNTIRHDYFRHYVEAAEEVHTAKTNAKKEKLEKLLTKLQDTMVESVLTKSQLAAKGGKNYHS